MASTMTGALRELEQDTGSYTSEELVTGWNGYLDRKPANCPGSGDVETPTHTTMGHKLMEEDFYVIEVVKKSWWRKFREIFSFGGPGRHKKERKHAVIEWESQ